MPQGPWEKYAAPSADQAGPWAKYRATEAPPAPPDQFAQDIDTVQKWADTYSSSQPNNYYRDILPPAARFLVHGGQAAANAITGTPGYVYHSIVDPATLSESGLTYPQRVAGRLTGATSAIEGYTDPNVKVTPSSAASVLPEALGTGVGNVAGGAVYGKLGEAAKVGASELNRIVPSTKRAGAGMGILEDVYQAHPNSANRFLAEAAKIQDELDPTGGKLPAEARGLIKRISRVGSMGWDELTFKEARDALDQFNKQIDFRNPKPSDAVYRRLAGALSEDIMESTGKPSPVAPEGFQADYQRMIDESRRGHQIIRRVEDLGPYAGALAGYEIGRQLGAPMGVEFGAGYLGRHLGKPIAGALARSVIERQGGPPNISPNPTNTLFGPPPPPVPPAATAPPVPPPPTAPVAPSATSVVPSAAELEGNRLFNEWATQRRTQGVPHRPPSAETEGMTPQEKEIWQQQMFGEAPAEDIGAKVRAANPEPTRAETKKAAQKKQPPPPPTTISKNAFRLPPEAYTRFLLEAKNGEISGDEANRRILKYGGTLNVSPIRRA